MLELFHCVCYIGQYWSCTQRWRIHLQIKIHEELTFHIYYWFKKTQMHKYSVWNYWNTSAHVSDLSPELTGRWKNCREEKHRQKFWNLSRGLLKRSVGQNCLSMHADRGLHPLLHILSHVVTGGSSQWPSTRQHEANISAIVAVRQLEVGAPLSRLAVDLYTGSDSWNQSLRVRTGRMPALLPKWGKHLAPVQQRAYAAQPDFSGAVALLSTKKTTTACGSVVYHDCGVLLFVHAR